MQFGNDGGSLWTIIMCLLWGFRYIYVCLFTLGLWTSDADQSGAQVRIQDKIQTGATNNLLELLDIDNFFKVN